MMLKFEDECDGRVGRIVLGDLSYNLVKEGEGGDALGRPDRQNQNSLVVMSLTMVPFGVVRYGPHPGRRHVRMATA